MSDATKKTPPATKTEAAPLPKTAPDQTDREVFAKITGQTLTEPAPKEDPDYVEETFYTPEKAEDPAPEKEAPKAPEKAEDEEDTPTVDEALREKADRTLRLKGIDDSVLEKLSPEDRISLWGRLQEREKATDKTLEENAKLRKQLDTIKAAETAEPTPVPPAGPDLEEATKAFADEFGEPAAKALQGLLGARDERASGLEAKIQALEARFEQGQVQQVHEAQDSARSRLAERFPELHDLETFGEVRSTMEALAAMPRYQQGARADLKGTVEEMMVAACRAGGLRERSAEQDAQDEREREKRAGGRPSSTSRKARRALTPEESDRKAFNHVMRHPGDVDGAKRVSARS